MLFGFFSLKINLMSILFSKFCSMLKSQFRINVKRWSDNARNYFNQILTSYSETSGIVHEASCVHTPSWSWICISVRICISESIFLSTVSKFILDLESAFLLENIRGILVNCKMSVLHKETSPSLQVTKIPLIFSNTDYYAWELQQFDVKKMYFSFILFYSQWTREKKFT